ncbi:MAG TPA: flagellar hook-associated protein FlgK, partial [Oxalobacteraceae bacterium]|nr:flagellar hook-associated protein FlgK [Oxalobacteraceae bacterium]
PNTGGVGDNRNALLLASLQTGNTLANGTASYQSAYGQLVNTIGNKAHELDVTSSAESALLSQAVQAQQSESGVNLDEEATNLLRYQQAYQAAGKVMQTASTLFNVLLTLGGP